MKNGNVMGFRGYRFFSPKSSKAKYKTLGTSEANFGGKKPRIILREVRYSYRKKIGPLGSKFFPFRVTPQVEVIQLAPFK